MSKHIEASIECPFYISEGDRFIECEGAIKGTNCVHNFTNNKEKRKHEMLICSSNCGKKCYHYRTLSVMYERGVLV